MFHFGRAVLTSNQDEV